MLQATAIYLLGLGTGALVSAYAPRAWASIQRGTRRAVDSIRRELDRQK